MRNRAKKLAAVILSLVLMAMFVIPVRICAQSFIDSGCEWGSYNFQNSDNIYLAASQQGNVISFDNKLISNDATIQMFITSQDIYFRFFDGAGDIVKNNSNADQSSDIIFSLGMTGIQEVLSGISCRSGSERWYVGAETNLQGTNMSPRQLMINELLQDGYITLWLKTDNWNGESERVLAFVLSSEENQFARLYQSAVNNSWTAVSAGIDTGTGSTASSGNTAKTTYSNDEIYTVCQNYISRFNDVVPYAQSLYETISSLDEHPIAGFLGGVLTLGASLEPFVDFIDAKQVFEKLDTNQMTSEQYSYYLSVKSSVNSTELGKVIAVIEFLADSGLLK